ncbi:MAG: PAS domain S-box protein [Oscillatoriaceae cyanobacterium Prado104]|jgi:PAS domain S-box-containing protein|nr:PAS domain S-box protein [Oscillatoriaceae cyanobacterium Prado104]
MAIYTVIGLIYLAAGILSADRTRRLKAVVSSQPLKAIASVLLLWNAIAVQVVSIGLTSATKGCNLYCKKINSNFLGVKNIFLLAARVLQKAVSGILNDRQSSQTDIYRFFNLSPDILSVIGFDGYFKQLNPAAEAILGYSVAEMLDRKSIDFVHPDDREATLKELAIIAAGNSNVYFENRWRCQDGSYKWLAWTANSSPAEESIYAVARDISDAKNIEKSLQEKLDLLYSSIDSTSDAIYVKDLQGHYIVVNAKTASILGKEKSEITGKTDRDLLPAEIADRLIENDRRIIASGIEETIEEIISEKGRIDTYIATKTPLRDLSGKIIGMCGISRNISDRKIAEEQLWKQKEFLRSIYDGVNYMIFVVDIDEGGEFRYVGWNPPVESTSGISSDRVCGKTPAELFPAVVADFFYQKLTACVAAGCSISHEETTLNYNGKETWLMTTLTPLRDESGKIYRIVGSSTDITERKQAEAQLREQEEFLNSIYNSVSQMIFVVDVCEGGELRYAGWNAASEASTGVSSSDAKGKTPEEIFPPEVAADFRQRYSDCLSAGSSIAYENGAVFNGVESWFVVTLTPLRDAAGNIYRMIGNTTDITERKQAEAALQESQHFVQKIADATPNILYLYDDIEQRNVYSNREILTILGYSIAEVQEMGSNLLPAIIHPDDFANIPKYWQLLEAAPDGEVVEWEYRIRNKQGDWRWLVSREIVFSRTESGKIQQRLGTATDVTERKLAEQALAEQLKLSVFTADVGICLTQNQTLRVTLQNCCDAVVRHLDAAFARIWVLNSEENVLELQASAGLYTHINGAHSRVAVGHLKIGLIAKERIPYLTNEVLEDDRIGDKEWAQREGMVAFAGYPLIVDEQLVGVIAMFSRQKLNESTLIALASVADTIALGIKRKQTEEALAQQQQTLRAIIDNAPIWVWLSDPAGKMLLVNKTFCEAVNVSEAKFLAASHYSEILGVEASANCMTSDLQAWNQNTVCYSEEILQLADGNFHNMEVIKTQVKDVNGSAIGLVGLGLDVTEQKEAQRNLQDSEARFRKLAQQEALVNQLASNIRQSLDFDTILATTVQQIRELLQLDRCLFIWYLPEVSPPAWNVTYEAKNADLPSLLGLYPAELTGSHAQRFANLEIISIDDTETLTDPVEREFFISIKIKSLLSIPVHTNSGKIGAIYCSACGTLRQWKDEEKELLIAVGNQLAIAINQAELYEKSRLAAAEAKAAAMQQKLLNQLASQIRASLDFDTILATTVQQVRELLQLDRCLFIWYLPDAAPPAWNIVHESKNGSLPSHLGYYHADLTGLLSQKIANLEIYQVDDVATLSCTAEREFFLQVGYKSVLDLPVKSARGLIGVLGCVCSSEVHQWTADEVDLLVAIGDQLAIAINQAELYTQSVDSARIAREQADRLEGTLCELQQAQTQLVQAEKMSSLGQMVAGIAHEINNPVSFIFGNLTYTEEYTGHIMKLLQMYREEYPAPSPAIRQEIEALDLDFLLDDLPKMLSSMQVGATRIRDIVRSLRTFSRLDESEMKKVDIREGIDSTLMILEHRLKAQGDRAEIQVVKEYGELPSVECYAGQLNQVFMNIIANAIDALEEAEKTSVTIRIRTEVEDNFAVIHIADSGTGIANEVKQRIFDPFFTTKPIGSGTGLGLAISHSIVVEKHKGKLLCISAPGKGTEFIIKIPICCQTSNSFL